MVLATLTYFFGGAGAPLAGGVIPFMRRYSTICPYSSEACTAMYAACVQRVDVMVALMVAPDGARLPTLSKAFAFVIVPIAL